MIGIAERSLLAISLFVVVVGLSGMATAILTSLNERRREMAILRSVGARPGHILSLVVGEAALLTTLGALLGVLLLYLLLWLAQPLFAAWFGLHIAISLLPWHEWLILLAVIVAGTLLGLMPAWRAYRFSLADGMTIRT
jgi:putative ABC transport system permease protein